jgi:hypothetical protein
VGQIDTVCRNKFLKVLEALMEKDFYIQTAAYSYCGLTKQFVLINVHGFPRVRIFSSYIPLYTKKIP